MQIQRLTVRSKIIASMRSFFDTRGYTEMHTQRLVGLPGQEPHLDPFWTTVSEPVSREMLPAALITSPEYAMKRLLAAGMDKIYDLGPCFRNNEPWDGTHDPEFLLLEWYRKNADLESLMDETEEMVAYVFSSVRHWQKQQASLLNADEVVPPSESLTESAVPSYGIATQKNANNTFRRMTVQQAWREYAGADLQSLCDNREAIAALARELGQMVCEQDTWEDLYFKIFLSIIEPRIADVPTFLYRYPIALAALARPCADDPRFADRVELYMNGLELANGFVELTDPVEQRRRFEAERDLRLTMGKRTWPFDERFLSELPQIKQAAGIAFGVDRLAMVLTEAETINDVIPFSARERLNG